tara:strand:+ start:243 stop:1262 length:1020 start_codon:yes stop_codon:yes gene_type:complete
VVLVDSKLLATIIAVAKKEAGTQVRDLSALEAKVEKQLQAFHKRSPILETPSFSIKGGSLYCTWSSGLTLDFGNIVGPQGPQGIQGPTGATGASGAHGKDGLAGVDGVHGKQGLDGAVGAAGKSGLDGKDGKTGPKGLQGPKGAPGNKGDSGIAGLPGVAGADGLKGLDGYDGEDGVGISKVWIDDNYHLTIQLTSGIILDVGYTRGKAGTSSSKGGRVTGYTGGGGTGGNSAALNISSVAYVNGNLILTRFDGTEIDSGPFPISTTLTWIDYVQNWKVVPSQIGTTSDGSVFSYEYTTSTFYRLVPNGTTLLLDSFYTSWDAATSVLDGFILDRSMNV